MCIGTLQCVCTACVVCVYCMCIGTLQCVHVCHVYWTLKNQNLNLTVVFLFQEVRGNSYQVLRVETSDRNKIRTNLVSNSAPLPS